MGRTKIIPELNHLLALVEKKYGRKLSSPAAFESLSILIEKETGELLSAATIKRLYGYVSMKPTPRQSTLDIMSRYIGFKDFVGFRNEMKNNPAYNSSFISTTIISSDELQAGDGLRIGWSPNRLVELEYKGDYWFEVVKNENSRLEPGDRFKAVSFMLNYPLYIPEIHRNACAELSYIAGSREGLNLLEKIQSPSLPSSSL